MRTRVVLLGVLFLVAVTGGTALWWDDPGRGDGLERAWLSETGVPVTGNHHPATATRVDGRGLVVAPVSGEADTDQCRLVALEAADGTERWSHPVPPEDCFVHSVGTAAVVDADGDGGVEVVAPTAEERLFAIDPETGAVVRAVELSAYGYSEAVAGPLLADGGRGLAVVDARGTVFVVRPDGGVAWSHRGGGYVWATPAVLDATGDGGTELVVGFGTGSVVAFGPGGAVVWNRTLPDDGAVTGLSAAPAEGTGPATLAAATDAGLLSVVDGDGGLRWQRDLGRLAAVGPVLDGDDDGDREVYATAADAVLRSFDAGSGELEWETRLTDADVQVTPSPAAGDVDGDGAPELVAVTGDGRVSVVDPADGTVLAAHARTRPIWAGGGPVPVWNGASVADTDGDGAAEVYVTYGDGRVLALEYVGS